jgi:molecular chaperone HscA
LNRGTHFELPGGVLSPDEAEALRGLAGSLETSHASIQQQTSATPNAVASDASHVIALNKLSFSSQSPKEKDLRLCLDFGTAMSKAWASGPRIERTVPLVLGRAAGTSASLAVPSAIFVSQSGRIYFGEKAERQNRQELEGRRPFDNIKRILSDQEVGQDLYDVPVDESINPTGLRLTKGDLLDLYLGWLTDMALRALDASADQLPEIDRSSLRYVRRRFAIPCFADAVDDTIRGDSRARWAEGIMKRSLLGAQVLADTLTNSWDDLTIEAALPILKQVRRLDLEEISHLLTITPSIREPVAAGASRFEDQLVDSENQSRNLMLVIDAGAGTTDFACFQVFDDPQKGTTRYSLLSKTVRMSRVAGNEFDAMLRPLVLKACKSEESDRPMSAEERRMLQADLDRQLRTLKSELFRAQSLDIALMPNSKGHLDLKELLESQAYKDRGEDLLAIRHSIFADLFDEAFLADLRVQQKKPVIHVLMTGGSASVPIIQRLAEGTDTISGVKFQFSAVEDLPSWVETLAPEIAVLLEQSYKQCAVALGGSAPELPNEIDDSPAPIMPPPGGPRVLERYQVQGL